MAEAGSSSSMEKQQGLLAAHEAALDVEHTEALADDAVREIMALLEAEKVVGARAPYCPIVYGSIAFKMKRVPKTSDDEPANPATHRWTLYLRAPDGRDLTYAIRAVEFKLHETFPEPIRVVSTPPFEVSDEGWGEFEAGITIHFHDPHVEPVRFLHHLRLHPPAGQATSHPADAPVVNEYCDELVFNDLDSLPAAMAERIRAGPGPDPLPSSTAAHGREYSAQADLAQLAAAHSFIAQETARLTERLARADAEALSLTQDLEAMGWSTAKSTRESSGSDMAEAASKARGGTR